jgi:hypothetical protein
MDHYLGREGGRLPGESGDVTSVGVEDLHPRVEMTHVRVGQVDERLDLVVDRADDFARHQIVDDDCAVLRERRRDLLGGRLGLDSLQLTGANS